MFVFYKAAEGQKISQKYIGTFIIGAFKHMQYVPEIVIAFDQVQDVYMCIFKDLTQLNTGWPCVIWASLHHTMQSSSGPWSFDSTKQVHMQHATPCYMIINGHFQFFSRRQ